MLKMTLVAVFLILSLVSVKAQLEGRTISTDTPLGVWNYHVRGIFKPAELCPVGEKVIGYRAQVQLPNAQDKVGLTGIEMKCSDGTVLGPVGIVTSGLGNWTEWRECTPGTFVTGFNLRYDDIKRFHRRSDMYGASQIKMRCSNDTVLGPDGIDMGKWARANDLFAGCSATSTFCGFAAEVLDHRGRHDDSGIIRIRFLCCTPTTGSLKAIAGLTPLGQDICIGSRNEKYGILKMPASGFLGAMTFIHVEGELACFRDQRFATNFGCDINKNTRDAFSIFVTTSDNQIILPGNDNQLRRDHLFYEVVGASSRDAKVFTLQPDEPTFFNKGDEIRVWYGEDLWNRHDWGNGDSEVCVHVYGNLMN